MNIRKMTEGNRAAWNQALEYHQKARGNALRVGFENPAFTAFDRDCDPVLLEKLGQYDLVGKTIAQLPCNNGRELLSLMKLGAKEAVGFDISDVAIEEARQLANIAKLNASFVRTDVLAIGDEYDRRFDFIYISEGSLQWFPDLEAFFSVVSRLLKKGGELLIFEMHPFAYFLENGFSFERQNWDQFPSYFEKGPYHYKDGLDYVGGVAYEAKECYWFMHKMSDIISAVFKSGIDIQTFEEYNLEMANNPSAKLMEKFPLSYLLTGQKKKAMPA